MRVFMDRSWLTTYAMFCTYAGNTLLLKKGNHRFAVDLATYYQKGSQLSEHMFITGLTGTKLRKTFFAGAAPVRLRENDDRDGWLGFYRRRFGANLD